MPSLPSSEVMPLFDHMSNAVSIVDAVIMCFFFFFFATAAAS